MNCPNCGAFNNQGSKFCIKCGQNISYEQSQNVVSQEIPIQNMNNGTNQNSFQTNVNSIQNQSLNNVTQSNEGFKVSFMSYIFIILAVILKPFTAFKEELNKFETLKNSALLSLIVSGFATIVNLIKTMFNTVRVKDYNWLSSEYTTTWEWKNLEKLDYIEVIGKNFLIYLGIIVAIAVVYYIASLIVKKQTNFSRLLGISALSVVPIFICAFVLSPLISMIYVPLGMAVIVVGAVYTIILLYEGINNEILIEGNAKFYINLICLSVLAIAAYYVCIELFMSSVSSGLGDLLDMFG